MESIRDARLREMVVAATPPGGRPRWAGPTSAPSDPAAREQWFTEVAERRRGLEQRTIELRAAAGAEIPDGIEISQVRVPVDGSCGRPTCESCTSGSIPAHVYRPVAAHAALPVYVSFHGGAFWLLGGDVLRTGAPTMATQAAALGSVVVDVDYRMAPEHKFPTPVQDCFAALRWVTDHAVALGVDPGRVGVGGGSAGAALAAAVTLMARDRGGPPVLGQVLEVPVTDSSCNSESMHRFATGYVFERGFAMDMWALYLAEPGDAHDPYASPAHALDLSGLPPALVIVGEYDPLRDEGLAYAARLAAGGATVTVRRQPMCHGTALSETVQENAASIVRHLRGAFS